MKSLTKLRAASSSALVAGTLVLAACSSSTGGASVSQSQVEAKLRKDSQISALKSQTGTHYDAVITCLAKTLKKDANGGDLDDYVNGDKSLNDISGDGSKAKTDAMTCVQQAIGSK